MAGFQRIAIVNRGEAAMRLIHAAREFPGDLITIALHTAAERRAMFVREADEAVCFDDLGIPITTSPYLNLEVLAAALRASRAQAVWVGWGFVAERPEFAELVAKLGLVFIGPDAAVMRTLGDKIGAKRLAEAADVPMAPWSNGPVTTTEEARAAAERIGFPLMVKAAAGGGGRGIRRVERPDDLDAAFASARSEGEKAFGDPTVFLEAVLTDARHVEVQIIADTHGTVWAPGVRDCSIQRRNQKVIEESSSTALSGVQARRLGEAAIRLATTAGYVNAGTVEFLYQPTEDLLAFLEVNTRLQVEHPVTEMTTGLDLVQLQLQVAMGERLEGSVPPARGHAIEARLNAEDPQAGFAPSPGRIQTLVLPTGPGIRVDTGVAEGDHIAPEYDSMIAKLIAWGADRDQARRRLRRGLEQTVVLVEGGTTNKSFLLDLIDRPEVERGDVDTGWLDRLTAAQQHHRHTLAEIGLVVAAIDVHDAEGALDRARFLSSAARGRPETDADIGHTVELRWGRDDYQVDIATGDMDGWYRVTWDDRTSDVVLDRLDGPRGRLTLGDRTHRVVSQSHRIDHVVEVDGISHRFSRDDGGLVRAPAVSLVVSVEAAPGDTVTAGQRIAVLEAMKMETVLTAPGDGVVDEVHVTPNTQVDAGGPIMTIRAAGDGDGTAADRPRLRLDAAVDDDTPSSRLDMVRSMLLGFDITDPDGALLAAVQADDNDDVDLRRRELGLLRLFADSCGLTREHRAGGEEQGRAGRSPHAHFIAYLRTLDADHEGLPDWFRDLLHSVLGHYGITDLERTPRLEAAVHRVHLADQRRREQLPFVQALLERRLNAGGALDALDELGDTLDRLVVATQATYPAIGNLARSVRHQCIDRPLLDAARAHVDAEAREALTALMSNPYDAGLVERLVAISTPLMPFIGAYDGFGVAPPVSAALTEVLTRRYYKIRELTDVTRVEDQNLVMVTARYFHRGRDVDIIAVACDLEDLPATLDDLAPTLADREHRTVVDLYVRTPPGMTEERVLAAVDPLVSALDADEHVRRVAVTAAPGGTEKDEPQVDVVNLSWVRDDADGFVENTLFRGINPMIGRRLQLWRLENFDVTRLPSGPDTHVYHAVAKDQPGDDRLIAVAEVRDATPVRDTDGSLIALPELERVLGACLEGLRQARSDDPSLERLEWNRVMLFVWPAIEISPEEVQEVARRLAPLTGGLGIEQVLVQGRVMDPVTHRTQDVVFRMGFQTGRGLTMEVTGPPTAPMQPLDAYTQKVRQCRRRGSVYPYELIPLLTSTAEGGEGEFVELDLDDVGVLVPTDRPYGQNSAGVIVGLVSAPTDKHPEGMTRVALFGDPTKAMGSITEAECQRLLAAIDLAQERGLPIEWFALSAGARIAMDSGSENLDWVAAVLRRIVEFTQAGGEINVIVAGINVGAQPYWNAEATMLMHTKGILVMTPDSAMVLTGKQAIDFSGGVSAENNVGIGGYERVMGPNGQAQYWAADMAGAVDILFAHYDHAYVAPGEEGPRAADSSDPTDRDVGGEPHAGPDTTFRTVGEIFDTATNPDRKKPFDIRSVIRAVIDHDRDHLERWAEMAEAEGAVVFDAHLGGQPVAVIGVESRPLPRSGLLPADGPAQWSAGTLFPLSSKKVARAINAASGNRPVVVLANLSGFDGSPESLRRLQLEYGAEIGRAIVNFDGRIVLCVISRYHGGAFVVFSGRLNDRMRVLAVEGARASVIGGAPAAAVVFSREVDRRTDADERIRTLGAAIAGAPPGERVRLRSDLSSVRESVRNEKLGEVAAEFDAVHSVERAKEVGSVHEIVAPSELRPALIGAISPRATV